VDEHEIRLIDHPAQAPVGVRRVARTDELGDVFSTLLPRVTALLDQLGVRPAGPPFGRYRDRTGDDLDVEVGFPVDEDVALPPVPAEAPRTGHQRCRRAARTRRGYGRTDHLPAHRTKEPRWVQP
jgi:hypothetical protein